MQALIIAISLWLLSSLNTNEKQLTPTLALETENTIKLEEALSKDCLPKENSWIEMGNASTEYLKTQIGKCSSVGVIRL